MVALEKELAYENEKPNIPVWVVVFDQNLEKVLLVRERNKRKEGLVDLPGGRPQPGETEVEAGIRELREETGLRAKTLLNYPENTYADFLQRIDGEKPYIGRAYIAVDIAGKLRRETRDIKQAFWARIDKLEKHRISPTVVPVVTQALDFLQSSR